MKPQFLSIGHITYDLMKDKKILGGSVTYSSLTARNLGVKAGVVTSVGENFSWWKIFEGIEIAYTKSKATTCFENIYEDGRRQKVLEKACKIEKVPEKWKNCEITFLAPVIDEIDLGILKVLKPIILGISIQGFVRKVSRTGNVLRKKWVVDKSIKNIDFLFFSDEDLPEYEEVLKDYLKFSKGVFVTKGKNGANLYLRRNSYYFPAYRTEEVDPTGAGDSFAAAFLVNYYKTKNFVEASKFATCTASFVVERIGIEGIPKLENILKRKIDYEKNYRVKKLPQP